MDAPNLYEWALGAISALLGWLGRQLYTDVKELSGSLAAHRVEVARDYVTNNELQRVHDKLDNILAELRKK
jgi:hypothetical protein